MTRRAQAGGSAPRTPREKPEGRPAKAERPLIENGEGRGPLQTSPGVFDYIFSGASMLMSHSASLMTERTASVSRRRAA